MNMSYVRESKFVFFLLIFILFANLSSALGLSPAEKTIFYEAGKDVNVDFFLINSEANNLNISLTAYGDLAGQVFFDKSSFEVSAAEYRIPFKVAIKLPQELSPGLHVLYIKASPVFEGGQGSFSAFVSPQVPIYVRVPYPEKYAQVRLQIAPVSEGVPLQVGLQFDNMGSEVIAAAGGRVEFFNGGKSMGSLSLPNINIGANSFAKTEGQASLPLSSGVYYANADAFYDNVSVKLNQSFQIGEPSVEIISFTTKNFKIDEINKVAFDARLYWNEPVAANVFIGIDGKFQELPSVRLSPNDEIKVNGFFDASGVATGDKDVTVRFVFGSQIKDYKYPVMFYPKGSVIASAKSVSIWLLIAIILLSIGVVIGLVFLLLKLRKNNSVKISSDGEAIKTSNHEKSESAFRRDEPIDEEKDAKTDSGSDNNMVDRNVSEEEKDEGEHDDNYTPDMDHPLSSSKK